MKKIKTRLALKAETIRALSMPELGRARGAHKDDTVDPYPPTWQGTVCNTQTCETMCQTRCSMVSCFSACQQACP
jgi:hypothetical protein